MDQNNIYSIIGILGVAVIFLFVYIFPLPSSSEKLGNTLTLHELHQECNSDIGILAKYLEEDINYLCSNYNKMYYSFIFAGILCIVLFIFSIINVNQKNI